MPVSRVSTDGSRMPPTPTDPTSIPTPTTASKSAMLPSTHALQIPALQSETSHLALKLSQIVPWKNAAIMSVIKAELHRIRPHGLNRQDTNIFRTGNVFVPGGYLPAGRAAAGTPQCSVPETAHQPVTPDDLEFTGSRQLPYLDRYRFIRHDYSPCAMRGAAASSTEAIVSCAWRFFLSSRR